MQVSKRFEAIIVKLISTGLATLKVVSVCVCVCVNVSMSVREREREKKSWIADETAEATDICRSSECVENIMYLQ
jgi:hypothetical protein